MDDKELAIRVQNTVDAVAGLSVEDIKRVLIASMDRLADTRADAGKFDDSMQLGEMVDMLQDLL